MANIPFVDDLTATDLWGGAPGHTLIQGIQFSSSTLPLRNFKSVDFFFHFILNAPNSTIDYISLCLQLANLSNLNMNYSSLLNANPAANGSGMGSGVGRASGISRLFTVPEFDIHRGATGTGGLGAYNKGQLWIDIKRYMKHLGSGAASADLRFTLSVPVMSEDMKITMNVGGIPIAGETVYVNYRRLAHREYLRE
jgi:hypothetical protein